MYSIEYGESAFRTVEVNRSNLWKCRPGFEVFMEYTCVINHCVDKSAGIFNIAPV